MSDKPISLTTEHNTEASPRKGGDADPEVSKASLWRRVIQRITPSPDDGRSGAQEDVRLAVELVLPDEQRLLLAVQTSRQPSSILQLRVEPAPANDPAMLKRLGGAAHGHGEDEEQTVEVVAELPTPTPEDTAPEVPMPEVPMPEVSEPAELAPAVPMPEVHSSTEPAPEVSEPAEDQPLRRSRAEAAQLPPISRGGAAGALYGAAEPPPSDSPMNERETCELPAVDDLDSDEETMG